MIKISQAVYKDVIRVTVIMDLKRGDGNGNDFG